MLHKPAGVLTAARDGRAQTVMDLVPPALLHRRVLPVGRLDKDTTGILILTNDGALAHALLAPGRHVWKRYVACVTGRLDGEDTAAFAARGAFERFYRAACHPHHSVCGRKRKPGGCRGARGQVSPD